MSFRPGERRKGLRLAVGGGGGKEGRVEVMKTGYMKAGSYFSCCPALQDQNSILPEQRAVVNSECTAPSQIQGTSSKSPGKGKSLQILFETAFHVAVDSDQTQVPVKDRTGNWFAVSLAH